METPLRNTTTYYQYLRGIFLKKNSSTYYYYLVLLNCNLLEMVSSDWHLGSFYYYYYSYYLLLLTWHLELALGKLDFFLFFFLLALFSFTFFFFSYKYHVLLLTRYPLEVALTNTSIYYYVLPLTTPYTNYLPSPTPTYYYYFLLHPSTFLLFSFFFFCINLAGGLRCYLLLISEGTIDGPFTDGGVSCATF